MSDRIAVDTPDRDVDRHLHGFQVMTCKDLASAPKSFKWEDFTVEPKMDGIRLYVVVDHGYVQIFTRTHREVTLKLPHLRDALEDWVQYITYEKVSPGVTDTRFMFDGELVYYNPQTGEVDFTWAEGVISGPLYEHAVEKQVSTGKWCSLMVFDCPLAGGLDQTRESLEFRRSLVATLLQEINNQYLIPMPWEDVASPEAIDRMTQRFGEGAVLKRRGSPYEYKRSGHWLKAKQEATADVVAMGAVMAAPGKFEGMIGALEFGQYRKCPDCKVGSITCTNCFGLGLVLTYRGKCSGMNNRTRQYITDNLDAILNRGDVFEIKHNGTFESGLFRHPNFLRWRVTEKDAHECVWDETSITVAKR